MSEPTVHLTLSGDLAAAVRSAAQAAGVTPEDWLARAAKAGLGKGTPTNPPGPGADPGPDADPGPATGPEPGHTAASLSSPDDWELVTEPNGIFTVPLPRGWQHQVAAVQNQNGRSAVYNTRSPDGATTIYGNDPAEVMRLPGLGSLFRREDKSAAGFGAAYLAKHYGKLPGFRVTGSAPLPDMGRWAQQNVLAKGTQVTFVDSATVTAEFLREGRPMTLAALVVTMGLPFGWAPQVMHVVSSGDAAGFVPACLHMYTSFKVTPYGNQLFQQDRMMMQQAHESTMAGIDANTAAMTAGHNERMRGLAAQNAAFQASMADRQQTFDAGVQSWRQQQAAGDDGHAAYLAGLRETPTYGSGSGGPDEHRAFLNTMREQETVVDGRGWEHQVEAGPDKYFYNEHQERFIGLQSHQDIHDVPGIDPDDWHEAPIRR